VGGFAGGCSPQTKNAAPEEAAPIFLNNYAARSPAPHCRRFGILLPFGGDVALATTRAVVSALSCPLLIGNSYHSGAQSVCARFESRAVPRLTAPTKRRILMAEQKLCAVCGTVGDTKRNMKGSILTELFLWLFFLLPGLIYSIWRHTTVTQVCRNCGSSAVIPLDSPVARQALAGRSPTVGQVVQPQVVQPQARASGMSPGKAIAIVAAFVVFAFIVWASTGTSPNTTHLDSPVPPASNSTTLGKTLAKARATNQGDDAAKLIGKCGKPEKDFTRNEGGQPIRHIIYKKQNIELMYSRQGVPAWALVGIFKANADENSPSG
jgi:hypothetical protein